MEKYAYVHCKPDGTPFYVGKGALRRAKNLRERNGHHAVVVSKYGRESIQIGMLACSSDDIAYDLERGLIRCLRRMGVALANYTDGGNGGAVNPCADTRKRISDAAKKRGVSLACQEARNAAKRGKPLSEAQKKRQSETMTGRVFSVEHRANISRSAKARGVSAAFRAACVAANTGRVQSRDEVRQRAKRVQAGWEMSGKTLKVVVDGVMYNSLAAASRATGLHSTSILYGLRHSGIVKGHEVSYGD